MDTKYTIFQFLQNLPKLEFFGWKIYHLATQHRSFFLMVGGKKEKYDKKIIKALIKVNDTEC
jgi:hypothetical protein